MREETESLRPIVSSAEQGHLRLTSRFSCLHRLVCGVLGHLVWGIDQTNTFIKIQFFNGQSVSMGKQLQTFRRVSVGLSSGVRQSNNKTTLEAKEKVKTNQLSDKMNQFQRQRTAIIQSSSVYIYINTQS